MWIYYQKSGRLIHEDKHGQTISFLGYAGCGRGKNNPALQNSQGITPKEEHRCRPGAGPLPRGKYIISELIYHEHQVGFYVLRLIPDPHNMMFNRRAFYIHGEDAKHIGASSDGCIIIPSRLHRIQIAESKDNVLEVTL